MATTSVNIAAPANKSVTTLSGYQKADLNFSIQPVFGDQIVWPNNVGLNVASNLSIVGPVGSYDFWHVRKNGVVAYTNYSISLSSLGTTTVSMAAPTGYTVVTLSGTITVDGAFTVQPIDGDQIVYPSGLTFDAQLNATGTTGTYAVYHIVASSGVTYKTNYTYTAPVISGQLSASVNVSVGSGNTLVTLATGFDTYVFEGWTPQPVAGQQIITNTANGYFDTLGNYYSEQEQLHDGWHVALNGTVTQFTIDSTGLSGQTDTTPDEFSFSNIVWQPLSTVIVSADRVTVAGVSSATNIPISINSEAEYSVSTDAGATFGAWTNVAGNVQLGHVVRIRQTTSSTYNATTTATLSIGGIIADWSATTLVADVEPIAFTFNSITNAGNLSAYYQSNPITVLGVVDNYNINISVYGGEYAISTNNGLTYGNWTNVSGSVQLGNVVKARIISSGSYSTPKSMDVTIGGVTGRFSVTTIAAPAVTSIYYLSSATGSDSNDGASSSTPFVSINKASNALTTSDYVYVLDSGEYDNSLYLVRGQYLIKTENGLEIEKSTEVKDLGLNIITWVGDSSVFSSSSNVPTINTDEIRLI